jgi:hypothetical protein
LRDLEARNLGLLTTVRRERRVYLLCARFDSALFLNSLYTSTDPSTIAFSERWIVSFRCPTLPHVQSLSRSNRTPFISSFVDHTRRTTNKINMASSNHDAQASTNYKEAFALFDKRGNGRVALDSLGDLLRACGQNPTLSEIRDLEKNVGSDCESSPPLRYPLR